MLFNPGTGTLKSTTVEAAFVEALVLLQIAEEAARVIDPTIPNVIAVNYFTGDKTVTVDIGSLPLFSTTTAVGTSYAGANYFNNVPLPAFSNAGSDILATNLPAAVVELALIIEQRELAELLTPEKNVSTSSINTSTEIFSFAAEFKVVMTQTASGSTQFAVAPYLL